MSGVAGGGAQRMRHSDFREEVRKAAIAWFDERSLARDATYRHVLASHDMWEHNLIDDAVVSYVRGEIDERRLHGHRFIHSDLHNGLSSQGLVFNLLGPLIVGGDLRPLAQVLERAGVAWPEKASPILEYQPPPDVFNERHTIPTSLDLGVLDELLHPKVVMEAKLTESVFGRCSLFDDHRCSGQNASHNFSLCGLHLNRARYWDLLKTHGFLQGQFVAAGICPLARRYQFYREVLLTAHFGGTFVLLYDQRNPSFFRTRRNGSLGGQIPRLLATIPQLLWHRVVGVTVQEVVSAIKASGRHPWIGEFDRKYGL